MDREDIIRMARAAEVPVQITGGNPTKLQIQRFAELVAAHVRETEFKPDWNNYQQGLIDGAAEEREACAAICDEGCSYDGDIIRARGGK